MPSGLLSPLPFQKGSGTIPPVEDMDCPSQVKLGNQKEKAVMKWMKGFLVLAMGVAMGLAVTGCGSDDDKDPLIGTWKLESYNGQPIPATISMTLTFNENGTVQAVVTEGGNTSSDLSTWSATGGILTVVSNGNTETMPYSISGNVLTLTESGTVLTLKKQ
jgi:hypothetical protein